MTKILAPGLVVGVLSPSPRRTILCASGIPGSTRTVAASSLRTILFPSQASQRVSEAPNRPRPSHPGHVRCVGCIIPITATTAMAFPVPEHRRHPLREPTLPEPEPWHVVHGLVREIGTCTSAPMYSCSSDTSTAWPTSGDVSSPPPSPMACWRSELRSPPCRSPDAPDAATLISAGSESPQVHIPLTVPCTPLDDESRASP
mmetsp:Transcript_63072/g.137099  ORF Transcript_63072/g.137099 Transcript_63072/m.137099 type:complete len:202 (+) Transcript_63072:507-1112(+)